MTGRELIKLIQDNCAEDMPVLIQYRDAGGTYTGGEEAKFCLAHGVLASPRPYEYEWDIDYSDSAFVPNVIVL